MTSIENLPLDIKKNISSFLSAPDAINLSTTSKTFNNDFPFSIIKFCPMPQETWYGHSNGRQFLQCGPRIPVVMSSVHSVTLKCNYRDQGWGDTKGMLYVVGHKTSCTGKNGRRFHAGRIVAKSNIAQNYDQTAFLSFSPRFDEFYNLWYKLGSGDENMLQVWDAQQYMLVYDNSKHGMRSTFEYLSPILASPERQMDNELGGTNGINNSPEVFLSLLSSVVQTLCESSQCPVPTRKVSNRRLPTASPIFNHFHSHGLNMADETIQGLQYMIPTVEVISGIISNNFIKYRKNRSCAPFVTDPFLDDERYLRDTHGVYAIELIDERTASPQEPSYENMIDLPTYDPLDSTATRSRKKLREIASKLVCKFRRNKKSIGVSR